TRNEPDCPLVARLRTSGVLRVWLWRCGAIAVRSVVMRVVDRFATARRFSGGFSARVACADAVCQRRVWRRGPHLATMAHTGATVRVAPRVLHVVASRRGPSGRCCRPLVPGFGLVQSHARPTWASRGVGSCRWTGLLPHLVVAVIAAT